MSAKGVLDQVRHNDRSMANTLPSTKRGRRNTSRARRYLFPEHVDTSPPPQPGSKPHRFEPELLRYDHCCGIHGAARERKGIKRGTSAARRRHDKEVIEREMAALEEEP
jgi:hypothetical protein